MHWYAPKDFVLTVLLVACTTEGGISEAQQLPPPFNIWSQNQVWRPIWVIPRFPTYLFSFWTYINHVSIYPNHSTHHNMLRFPLAFILSGVFGPCGPSHRCHLSGSQVDRILCRAGWSNTRPQNGWLSFGQAGHKFLHRTRGHPRKWEQLLWYSYSSRLCETTSVDFKYISFSFLCVWGCFKMRRPFWYINFWNQKGRALFDILKGHFWNQKGRAILKHTHI